MHSILHFCLIAFFYSLELFEQVIVYLKQLSGPTLFYITFRNSFQPLSFSSFCFTFFFFLSDTVSYLSTCEVLRTCSSFTSGISYQVSFLLHSYPLSLFRVLNIFLSLLFLFTAVKLHTGKSFGTCTFYGSQHVKRYLRK